MAKRLVSNDSTIIVCHCLSELERAIESVNRPLVIFDIDNVSRFEKFCFFKLMDKKIKNLHFLILTEYKKESIPYSVIKHVSPFVLSKTTPIEQLENLLWRLIYSPDSALNIRIQQETLKESSTTILTQREHQICQYILSGLSNTDIADLLDLSPKTISTHKINIYKKYRVKGLFDLHSKLNK
ncbi:TPA: response regulator transcription factor [Yersinia enterocolitica]|nr:response regulator transcription factor [Yersinia enterocolitica]